MRNRVSFVNPLQGTYSTREYSRGNTLPIVARPWGMHHWTLQTAEAPWLFHPDHRKLQGIRLTHQPSPWMEDYASVLISCFTGPVNGTPAEQASAYRIEDAILSPNYLRVEALRYGLVMEMAPTEQGALFSFTFGSTEQAGLRLTFPKHKHVTWERGSRRFTAEACDHKASAPEEFTLKLCGDFDHVPERCEETRDGAVFFFPVGLRRLELRLAGSFISQEMAELAAKRELYPKSLSEIRTEGGVIWEDLLDRIDINEAHPDQIRTFYSCLYRCLLFPRLLNETDADGNMLHRSSYDGSIHRGPLCTDNGFWDTFRTVYPLLALVYPDKLRLILEGWLNACREAGWSPKWASPGLRDCMIGTHFDAVVADAISKGVTDWDVELAYEFLHRNATEPSPDGRYGRRGLEDYIALGYVPTDGVTYSVSRTLDFSYNDYCVARVADYVGRREDAREFDRRAQSYRNVYDRTTGFMRGRDRRGQWEEFREFRWGGSYIEGGPWQHSFNVPHDPSGLAALHGGPQALLRKIDSLLATPPRFEIGTYPEEIHEMTEMALASFGQYAHSNQPVHNYLFYYSLFGDSAKTSHWVHRVAGELYTPSHLPGDEDNGEMSAWYVFACLGVYPFCPGSSQYVEFDPIVLSAELKIPTVGEILLFGRQHPSEAGKNTVAHDDLVRGLVRS